MNPENRLEGVLRYVRARWPTYLVVFGGGGLVALAAISAGAQSERWSIAALGLAVLLVLAYFLTTSLWAAYEQHTRRQILPSHVIFELGGVQPTDQLVYVGLGVRETPVQLSRRLTRGRVQAIDVYNPQLTPATVLARQRHLAKAPPSDPRLIWLDGSIDLLPLPDNSANLVAMSYSLVEFWQDGDRRRLLRELRRILKPGSYLILAEPARTRTQLLMLGPAALRLPSPEYWRNLLQESGFQIVREKNVSDYYLCFRAEKPFPGTVQQLALDFGI